MTTPNPFAAPEPGTAPQEPAPHGAPPPGYGGPGYGPPAYGPPAYGPPGYGPPMPAPSPYGQFPPPQYGGAPFGGFPSARTNGMAIASLVLGVLWVYWIGSILALVFGYVAKSQIKRSGESGGGLATAGIVLGWIGVAFLALFLVLGLSGAFDPGYESY